MKLKWKMNEADELIIIRFYYMGLAGWVLSTILAIAYIDKVWK